MSRHRPSRKLDDASEPSAWMESEYQRKAPIETPASPVTAAPTRVFGGSRTRTRPTRPIADPSGRGCEDAASTTFGLRRTAERSSSRAPRVKGAISHRSKVWRDMVVIHAAIAMAFSFATVAASPQAAAAASGTLSSIAVTAAGAVLTIATASGSIVVTVPPTAKVRQRAIGGDWSPASLADIRIGEPLRVVADPSGRIVEVDAEYALVETRNVVMQDGYLV